MIESQAPQTSPELPETPADRTAAQVRIDTASLSLADEAALAYARVPGRNPLQRSIDRLQRFGWVDAYCNITPEGLAELATRTA